MIDILLATYNGEKFIEQQLETIINQSYTDWKLIVRDDCSSDQTTFILQKYQQRYPDSIIIIPSIQPSGSAMNNFFMLLDYADSEYIMFSDQDDVWKRDKISVTFAKMKELEDQYGSSTPLLVHTDLCVVDESLKTINPSLFQMQDMDYKRDKLNNLLVTNIVTGCTMLFNRALLKLLVPKPKVAVMHDMWIAMVAAAFGKIGFVNEATILYRQHGKNENGAKDINSFEYIKNKFMNLNYVREFLNLQYRQAEEFFRIYQGQLSHSQKSLLLAYSSCSKKNWLEKAFIILKYDLNKKGIVRLLGQLFC